MILVSACLLGHKVKYNGGSNDDSLLQAYNVQGRFVAVCPECFARAGRELSMQTATT